MSLLPSEMGTIKNNKVACCLVPQEQESPWALGRASAEVETTLSTGAFRMKQGIQPHRSMYIYMGHLAPQGAASSCAHTCERAVDAIVVRVRKKKESNTLVWSHGEEGP